MPTKDPPFGSRKIYESLSEHMPRKLSEYKESSAPVVNVVPHKGPWEVTFERDEYGRIKSPITIKPK